MRKILFLLSFLVVLAAWADAQNHSVTASQSIDWIHFEEPDMLPFEGEGHLDGGLPVYRFRLPVQNHVMPNSIGVQLDNVIWQPSEDYDAASIPFGDAKVNHGLVYIRKQAFVEVELVPLRNRDGNVERITDFDISVAYSTDDVVRLKSASADAFAANSVLSSGRWLKIAVNQTGVHRIPYSTLSSWGFSSPANVSVFGFGGQMVPQVNSADRPDDLPQVAVWHHNNNLYFFANGPVSWQWNDNIKMFTHTLHFYSEKAFYFLTEDAPQTIQVATLPAEVRTPNYEVTHFDERMYHENELVNIITSGRKWYGERFNVSERLERNFEFQFPSRDVAKPVKINTAVVGRSAAVNSFEYYVNDAVAPSLVLMVPAVSLSGSDSFFAQEQSGTASFTSGGQNVNIRMRYTDQAPTSFGRLDYITLNARSHLQMHGAQLLFRDYESGKAGNISRFTLGNVLAETRVWDVTNILTPADMPSVHSNNRLEFVAESASYREYVAFNPSGQLPVPERVGVVANQDLHATQPVDYVIVAHRDFLSFANQLAAIHQQHNGLSTLVVLDEQIFNEFSWGHRDPTAIRSFMRMLYERAGDDRAKAPKYLLLFGNGSYDNRTENPATRSLIVTYQSENSIHRTNSYVTDDYFGFLDRNEGTDIRFDRLDIGIGRFPVRNVDDARVAVNKIRSYYENQDPGQWRKLVTFIADDGDFNIHQRDADFLAQKIENSHQEFDVRKIYLDNYRKTTVSTGKLSPDAHNYINRTVNEGTLIMNYVGHGNPRYLADEMLITNNSISNWTNMRRLPLFVTATCEFSRFDNPAEVSAGEQIFLTPNGGGIGLLTTTRVVFSSLNFQLNNAFFNHVFKKNEDGSKPSLGDIIMNTKNSAGSSVNKLNFLLLGDPAVKLLYPDYYINTLSVNGNPVGAELDTLKALSKAVLQAEVTDRNGQRLADFNGTVDVTVYDKPMNVRTLGNDGATPFEFSHFVNILFKGKATVVNGEFSTEFVVPHDIRYNFARGKISYYAHSPQYGEAFGAFRDIVVGGFDVNALPDNDGPEVNLYLNHPSFKPGDVTGSSPMLYVNVFDPSGINTSGSGIGHDIILIINGNRNEPIVLNNYFQAKPDTYKEGQIVFQLPVLPAGSHQLALRVWDTHNNSTIVETHFVVGTGSDLKISNFTWSPNPISGQATGYFAFDLEEPNAALIITAEVMDLNGATTGKQILRTVAQNNRVYPMPLSMQYLGVSRPGVYFIRFQIRTETGKEAQVVEKLLVRP